jgi:hypothetical protein
MFKYVNAGSSQSLKLDGLVVSDSNSIPFVRIKKKSIPFVKNPDIVHQRNLVEVSLYRLCDFTMPGSDLVQQRLLLIFMEISSSSHWEVPTVLYKPITCRGWCSFCCSSKRFPTWDQTRSSQVSQQFQQPDPNNCWGPVHGGSYGDLLI